MVARNVKFQSQILEIHTSIDVSIFSSYKSAIDFRLHGCTYTFTIEKWANRGLNCFLEMFHSIPRDASLYGVMIKDEDGNHQFYEDQTDLTDNGDGTFTEVVNQGTLTSIQKLNIIEQACRDVISCLNQISANHQRSLLEYCI